MKERILVIDDDELVRTGLVANLAREGYDVEAAEAGEEGLEKLAAAPADLVLCDLVLGGIDGIEVLRRVRERAPDTAVILITGHGSIGTALAALQSGASDYIQKPANPEEVLHRLRTVLDASKLRRALQAEREKADERRRDVQRQLISSERMVSLGLLAEGAAEDLHGILSPVSVHLARLRELAAGHAESLRLLDEIESAGRKAEAVVHDLQTIGKGGVSQSELLDLAAFVRKLHQSEECRKIQQTNPRARLEVAVEGPIPLVKGSAVALREVLINLVTNACESASGGGVVNVRVRAAQLERAVSRYGTGQPGEYVIVEVADKGPGLQREDLERIFEPFYTRMRMGRRLLSGLGMTLVYRVVQDHGGFIDIRTAAGQGTTFLLYLPAAQATRDQPLELRPDYSGTETVLVVDDYEQHRNSAATILRQLGYHVMTAESGRTAVKLVERRLQAGDPPIDLAVIDLVLGDEFDGVETYKALIALCPGQKAVMVSGFADIQRIVEARQLGVGQCIQKPYALEPLGRAVRSELDGG